jgi:GTP pyrophosphokinase
VSIHAIRGSYFLISKKKDIFTISKGLTAMNTTPFFTPEEKKAFLSAYRVLLTNISSCLEKEDIMQMKALMKSNGVLASYDRDVNGINGFLRNMQTALIAAADIGLKRIPILALLLYRPVYKQIVTLEAIEKRFDADISLMIQRLLKTSDLYARNVAVNTDNFHHLLFSFAEDIRVILIMIADRLCMMRLGKVQSEEDRKKMATEVLYLYAPLSHRLGLNRIKSELEDLSLKFLEPEQYKYIKDTLNETKRSRDAYIEEFIEPVRNKLKTAGMDFDIKGRTKSIYSINNKLKQNQMDFENIYDLFAIRVILESAPDKERADCWHVFSIITDMYQPNPKRMRDWLSVPKKNGYESLHITVLGPRKRWVEVQIRTRRMDEIAEKGLAAHWKYKGVKEEPGLDEFIKDVRSMLETQNANPSDMIKEFKMNLYQDEIYVFTPNGELIKLGKGATVLDFAFAIHSQLGYRCVSGKVNGKNVSIRHVLNNGDSVEIITSSVQKPKQDWLSIVTSSKARTKIRQALREESVKAVEYAKELLQRRFKNRKIEIDESVFLYYIKKKGFKTVTDFYICIAEERLDIAVVIDDYLELKRKETESAEHLESRSVEQFVAPTVFDESASHQDVMVIDHNLTGIEYKLAKCCNPIFGDPVFGFVSTQGIKIHRNNCPNAPEIYHRF